MFEPLHCVNLQDVPLCCFPGFYDLAFITSHITRFLPALLHVGISYWTNSKNAAVLWQRAAAPHEVTQSASGVASLALAKPTNRKQLIGWKYQFFAIFILVKLQPIQKQTHEKSIFKGDALGHAVIGFQWQHNERKIVNPFVPFVPLPTPPPYFILQALFILSPHLPFT